MRRSSWPSWLCFLGLLCASLGASPVEACKWDYDTLQMERQRFPGALELLSGKFLRHSKAFYQWRIKDRLQKIKAKPEKLSYYDDLASAYDSVGDPKRAIHWMLEKEKKKPGLYETYANLGTFYIHDKQLAKGLGFIKKAIEINPNAHFGREVWQAHLVEYLLFVSEQGKWSLPLSQALAAKAKKLTPQKAAWLATHHSGGFVSFLQWKNQGWRSHGGWDKQRKKAVKGVLGMMRFGNFRSPVLLEALGDLLGKMGNNDGKRMAARAYLQASYVVKDPKAKAAYRARAKSTLSLQTPNKSTQKQLPLESLEKSFQEELTGGKAWLAQIEKDEKAWIAQGVDPEKAFARKYYKPRKKAPLHKARRTRDKSASLMQQKEMWLIGGALLMAVLMLLLMSHFRSSKD